jgi:deazaflavin-dependent oxidoreductase (nitroreductase family)
MNKRAGIAAVVVFTPVAAATVLVLGIRTRYRPVVNLVRRLARDTGNPRVMKTARTPGGPASIIMHTGRVSGKSFRTPVTPMATEDGFVIALPYGSDTDWVKNVLAAGSAGLVHEGQTYALQGPEVIPLSEAAAYFGTREGWFLRLFGVQECLRLHRVEAVNSAG